jgi:hypothetical protein
MKKKKDGKVISKTISEILNRLKDIDFFVSQ